jgi:NAD(P)-dependent dehydrogenase (short-subunit alcohol dehydrogenase family)
LKERSINMASTEVTPGNQGLVLVAGAGPGLGQALLHRFSAGGYRAVGLARNPPNVVADLTDAQQVGATIQKLIAQYGPPKVVIHNPARLLIAPLMETSPEDFEAVWRAIALSAFHLAQATLPVMAQSGGGVFIASGATASLRGGAKFCAFASAKFALRGLMQSLARQYQSQGVHVAHVVLDGIIDNARSRTLHGLGPERMMQTADIAESYWQLAHQNCSTWTHELDLRPASESF